MAPHSPAPWREDAVHGFILDAEGEVVAQTWNKAEDDFANATENRPLLAAAPDLLAALERTRTRLTAFRYRLGPCPFCISTVHQADCALIPIMDDTAAAIAKAKGEAR